MFPMLSKDLNDKIADEACTIRSNGKASNNIQVRVKTNKLPSECEAEVVQWLLRCLEHDAFAHVQEFGSQFPWKIVSNVVNEIDAPDKDGNHPLLVVAVRIGQREGPYMFHKSDEHDLVVLDEEPERPNMIVSAASMANVARQVAPPPCVDGVGFSAVSDNFMKELWIEIISKEPNCHDVAGRGYMVHPMWMRFGMPGEEGCFWSTVREQSFNFGWENYFPETRG